MLTKITMAMATASLLLTIGCSDAVHDPLQVLSPESVDEIWTAVNHIPDAAFGQPAQMYLAIEAKVPGFGGFFFDATGTPTVYTQDMRQRAAIEREISALTHDWREMRGKHLRVLVGDYSWRDLVLWHAAMDRVVLDVPGVVYTYADEEANRVVIAIRDESIRGKVLSIGRALRIPDAAVLVVHGGPVRQTSTLTDYVRPVIAGLQIAMDTYFYGQDLCTVGFAVDSFNNKPLRGFLTASHCSIRPAFADTQPFWSPTYSNGHAIGHPKPVDPIIAQHPYCPKNKPCRESDMAIVQFDDSVSDSFAQVASISSGITIGPTPYKVVSTDYNATHVVKGNVMEKVGSATGFTSGPIHATGVSLPDAGIQNGYIIYNVLVQVASGVAANNGDSGAPVFADRGFPSIEAEGILWGVTSVTNGDDTFIFSTINGFKTDAEAEPILH